MLNGLKTPHSLHFFVIKRMEMKHNEVVIIVLKAVSGKQSNAPTYYLSFLQLPNEGTFSRRMIYTDIGIFPES